VRITSFHGNQIPKDVEGVYDSTARVPVVLNTKRDHFQDAGGMISTMVIAINELGDLIGVSYYK